MQTLLQGDHASGVRLVDACLVPALMGTGLVCALTDDVGRVIEMSPGFEAILPDALGTSVGARLGFDFRWNTTDVQDAATTFGTYETQLGERVPALIQLIGIARDEKTEVLVIVIDGSAFRKAETRRFESTPCPILRVSLEGRVTYANSEVFNAFAQSRDKLIGFPLPVLFCAAHRRRVKSAISRCARARRAVSLESNSAMQGSHGGRPVRLVLTPEVAPGGAMLGVFVVIEDAIQTVRERIRGIALKPETAIDPSPGQKTPYWHTQLDLIFAEIRKLIEFDHANFGLYANDATMFRAICLFPQETKKNLAWPARYLDVPSFVPRWLKSRETWIDDMERFVARDPKLLKSEVVKRYHDFGINSSVTLPVFAATGHPTSALTLCSKEPQKYCKRDLNILRELDLEPILLRCEESQRVEREKFAASIRHIIDERRPLRGSAQEIIAAIKEQFDWDFVGFFRVNRHKKVFELFYQVASDRKFRMPDDYEQPIGEGMLASSLDGDCVRMVNEIGESDVDQYGYVGGDRGLKSAMTVPVHLDTRVRWVLDVECATAKAFCGPDEAALRDVVASLEQSLMTRMLREMNTCLMKEADRGVILVGTEGAILEMNETAARLLNCDEMPKSESVYLFDYAGDARSSEILKGDVRTTKRRVKLKTKNASGHNVTVLATRVDLDPSFDTAFWFFNDIEGMQWTRSVRFLQETVSEVAQQTRAPLTLASLLAREITDIVSGASDRQPPAPGDKSKKITGIASRMVCELGKADITFERLAEAMSIREAPRREKKLVNLNVCLQEVYECLPEQDRELIMLQLPEPDLCLKGDEGRLRFVLRSIIAHLLRLHSDGDVHILIELKPFKKKAVLLLTLQTPSVSPDDGEQVEPDDLLRVMREAREAASLSLGAIQLIVKMHRGTIETASDGVVEADGSSVPTSFTLSFPKA